MRAATRHDGHVCVCTPLCVCVINSVCSDSVQSTKPHTQVGKGEGLFEASSRITASGQTLLIKSALGQR